MARCPCSSRPSSGLAAPVCRTLRRARVSSLHRGQDGAERSRGAFVGRQIRPLTNHAKCSRSNAQSKRGRPQNMRGARRPALAWRRYPAPILQETRTCAEKGARDRRASPLAASSGAAARPERTANEVVAATTGPQPRTTRVLASGPIRSKRVACERFPGPLSVPRVRSRSSSERATGRPSDSGRVIGQPIGRSTLRRDGFAHSTSGVRLGRCTGHRRRDLRCGCARPDRSAADDSADVAGVRRRRPARVSRGWPERRPRTCTPRRAAWRRRLTIWTTRARTVAVACLDASSAASSELKAAARRRRPSQNPAVPRRRERRSMVRGQCRCIPKI